MEAFRWGQTKQDQTRPEKRKRVPIFSEAATPGASAGHQRHTPYLRYLFTQVCTPIRFARWINRGQLVAPLPFAHMPGSLLLYPSAFQKRRGSASCGLTGPGPSLRVYGSFSASSFTGAAPVTISRRSNISNEFGFPSTRDLVPILPYCTLHRALQDAQHNGAHITTPPNLQFRLYDRHVSPARAFVASLQLAHSRLTIIAASVAARPQHANTTRIPFVADQF